MWALGCVLYEMLTGSPAFHGGDTAGILARVLEREPDWTRLREVTPAVQQLLRLCLEKDRIADRPLATCASNIIPRGVREPQLPCASRGSPRVLPLVGDSSGGWRGRRFRIPVFAVQAAPAGQLRVEILTPSSLAPFQFALSPDGRYSSLSRLLTDRRVSGFGHSMVLTFDLTGTDRRRPILVTR